MFIKCNNTLLLYNVVDYIHVLLLPVKFTNLDFPLNIKFHLQYQTQKLMAKKYYHHH